MLKAYFCHFVKDDEWGSYVVAVNRGQAKSIFHRQFKDEGIWNDIRCFKVKDISDDILIAPQCLDRPEDPVLKLLGLEYQDIEYQDCTEHKGCFDCKYFMWGSCLHPYGVYCMNSELWTPVGFGEYDISIFELPNDVNDMIQMGVYTEEEIVEIIRRQEYKGF